MKPYKFLTLFIFCLIVATTAFADPSLTSVSGDMAHRQTVIISGSDFGSKSPAAPMWWDDGEGATNNQPVPTSGEIEWAVSNSLNGGQKHYNDVWPKAVTQDSGISNMRYRSSNHRNVPSPHYHSQYFLSGCHDDQGECRGGEVGQNVGLTIGDNDRHNVWYVSYYLRLDPLWPTSTASGHNYKWFNWEMGNPRPTQYSSPFCYVNTNGCYSGGDRYRSVPACNDRYWSGLAVVQILNMGSCPQMTSPNLGSPIITHDTNKNNPRVQWTREEHLFDYSNDEYKILVDNAILLDNKLYNGCAFNKSTYPNAPSGVTIGGYWREGMCGGTQDDLNDNACRYFDDIYVDNTYSRVILGNRSTYESCTILEPQIPSTWTGSRITIMVNQGAIADSQAYLYVFDADNNHNAAGFPVSLSGSNDGGSLPTTPTGLRVVSN